MLAEHVTSDCNWQASEASEILPRVCWCITCIRECASTLYLGLTILLSSSSSSSHSPSPSSSSSPIDLLPQLKTMIDTLYKQEIKQTTEKKQMDKCRGSLQENLDLNKQIFQKTDDVKYKEIEQIQEGVPFCG